VSPAPRILVALAFVAFVSLGLPDCVLGVAWPSIRHTFDRPLSQLGYLLTGGTIGYLCSSFLGGQVVRLFGVGRLLVGSSLLVAISLAGYWLAPAWPLLIASAVVGGLGAGAIDTGINTFAAHRFSPRVVNWLHASWGIGATTGPLLMTAVLAAHLGWRTGYAILAAALLLLAIVFAGTLRLWEDAPDGESTPDAPAHHPTAPVSEALRRPIVWTHALLFFVYAGIESTAGQLLYTLFTESRGFPVTTAGVTIGAYWAALTVGRIVFGQLAAWVGHLTVLRAGMLLAPCAAALIAWNPFPAVSFAGTILLGFALAPVFPTLISVTPERVGRRYAPHAVGFQVAAASIGIAFFPGAVGLLARHLGLESVCAYLVAASLALFALHELALRLARAAPAPGQTDAPAVATPSSGI
jgi:fucose permease